MNKHDCYFSKIPTAAQPVIICGNWCQFVAEKLFKDYHRNGAA
jgi:hypothetical protein